MRARAGRLLAPSLRRRARAFPLLDALPVPVLVLEPGSTRVRHANASAAEVLGPGGGQDLADVLDTEGRDLGAWCRDVLRGGPAAGVPLTASVDSDGTRRWFSLAGSAYRAGGRQWLVVTLTEQTALRELTATVERRTIDPLTGLANRAAVEERLRATSDGVVAIFDLDRFKEVNDRYGHLAGDTILREVASRLRAAFPWPATVARFGGDEFVVLLPDVDPEQAAQRCQAVLLSLGQPVLVDGTWITVTASVGLGSVRGVPPEAALARADAAMYAAKSAGRGAVQDYATPTTVGRSRSRSQVFDTLHALEEQALTDALTGLPNLRALHDALQQVQAQSERSGQPFSVVFLDVDRFGAYNRAHGDSAGDVALVAVARQLAASCRAGDSVYRKGGEELVALLPATAAAEAATAAERLRASVEGLGLPHRGLEVPGVLTITAGVTTSRAGEPAADVLERAGSATTAGKNAGRRNTVLPAP